MGSLAVQNVPGQCGERTTYRGARGKDGNCNFQGGGSVSKPTAGSVVIERAVSTNINQCLMETERTTLQAADAVARGLVAPDSTEGATSSGAAVEGGSELQLQDGFQYSGHFKSKFIDPASLDVNWASANIDWSSNGSCMTGWHRWDSYYWLTATGWGRGGYGQDGTPGGTLPCNEIWQKVWANYYNYWFCGLTPTYANHNDSQYHAFANGGSSWSWDVWWGGACYWLLAFNTEVDFN